MRLAGLRQARLVGLAALCAAAVVPAAGSAPRPAEVPLPAHARTVSSTPVAYAYDPAGRISAITTGEGSATYAYDPVGNILSIARIAPGTLSVFEFYPRSGRVGDTVTLSGAAFDTTPANDTVRFNGTPAAVQSASATSLVVTVPNGATTGTISVQAGGQTATSIRPFTVHGDLTPTITSVSPTTIVPGDTLTISGSRFSTDKTLDDVALDGTELHVLTATATTITAALPAAHGDSYSDPNKWMPYATGSGHVTVTTSAGQAASGSDVYVGLPGWDSSYTVQGGRVAVGGSVELNAQTGRHAMALFDGQQGQRITIRGDDLGPPVQHINFYVIAPHRFLTIPEIQPQTSPFATGTMTLPSTGTYAIVMDTSAGGADWRFTVSSVGADLIRTVRRGGAAVPITTTTPGQGASLAFAGKRGRVVSLRTSGSDMSGTVSLVAPDGWRVVDSAPFSAGSGTPFVGIRLPGAGRYTVLVNPAGDQHGHVTLQLVNGRTASVAPRPASVPGLEQALATYRAGPEEWIPGEANRHGDWTTHRASSPWQLVPALRARPGVTALSGQLLRLNGLPLKSATLELGAKRTRTDRSGRFLLRNLKPGRRELTVLGGKAYGRYSIQAFLGAHQTNVLPFTVWMTRIDWRHSLAIPTKTRHRMVLTTPRIPGLKVIVPAGTRVTDDDGHAIHRLSITPVPVDRAPWPLPQMTPLPMPTYYTIQPGGAYVHGKGLQVIYPNALGARPHSRMAFWDYDPGENGWHVYRHGRVSADGRSVVPDANARVWELTGYAINVIAAPPPRPLFCSCESKGDPVDPHTGLFILNNTDLVENDVMPLALDRVYRQNDSAANAVPGRPFGVGATTSYQMGLVSLSNDNSVDLSLPDGGLIHYKLVSGSPDPPNAVWKAAPTPSEYGGSSITYNRELSLWQLTLRDGSFLRLGPHQPVEMIGDRHDNEVDITRYAEDEYKVDAVTSPNGRWIQFGYPNAGNSLDRHVSSATDALGRTVRYGYDSSERLTSVTDPAGGVTRYTWSGNRIAAITDPRGIVVLRNSYTKQGRIKKQVHADGGAYTFSYKAKHGRIVRTTVTDPRRMRTVLDFDKTGYLVKETRGAGTHLAETVTIRRQKHSPLVASYTDPLKRKTIFGYDGLGNVTRITRLAGTRRSITSKIAYDLRFSEPARLTDPLKHSVGVVYDAKGDPATITDQVGRVTRLVDDLEGRSKSVTDPLGHVTTYTYTGGDLVSVLDPLGRTSSVFTDAAGEPRVSTDARGETSSATYTALGEHASATDPLGDQTSFLYDPDGNLARVTDANGHVTGYGYDVLGRLEHVTDGLGRVTTFKHDRLGRLTRITRPSGRVTTYTRDLLGRLTAIGRFVPGAHRAQTRDTYLYDRVNRVLQAKDSATGPIALGYDPLDRLIAVASAEGVVRYAYDKAGRRTSMHAPHGQSVIYKYNPANQLIREGNVSFAYDPAGRLQTETFASGVTMTAGYDAASEPISLTYAHGGPSLGSLAYAYDPSGRVDGVTGSLATASLPVAVSSATYDPANELTRWNGVAFSYDVDGNLTGDGNTTYAWDAGDRLVGAGNASYAYDALGRRLRQTSGGVTTSYLYDGPNVLQELVNNRAKATLLPGPRPDQYLRRTDSTGARDLLPDAQGNTIGLANPDGVIVTQYGYDPFGGATASGEASANEFQFHGMPKDPSGLSYDRARYYDHATGRFVSPDPLGAAGDGPNVYAFAAGDPVDLSDPTGLRVVHYAGETAVDVWEAEWADWLGQEASCVLDSVVKWAVANPDGALAIGLLVGAAAIWLLPESLFLDEEVIASAVRGLQAGGDVAPPTWWPPDPENVEFAPGYPTQPPISPPGVIPGPQPWPPGVWPAEPPPAAPTDPNFPAPPFEEMAKIALGLYSPYDRFSIRVVGGVFVS